MSTVLASLDPERLDPYYGMASRRAAPVRPTPVGWPRAWRAADLAQRHGDIFVDLGDDACREIIAALAHVRANGFTLANVQQEDIRIPALAARVPALRAQLDHGIGFLVLRGLPLDVLSSEEALMLTWSISNYFGPVIRQNYSGLRVELLKDQRRDDGDPYRISQTNRFFDFHSDNGVLEPRPPNYIGLTCLHPASRGGESVLVSSCTLHDEMLRESPGQLALLFDEYAADKPALQTRAGSQERPVRYPIFERRQGDLIARYNRIFLEQGALKAGKPLSADVLAAFDRLDALMRREALLFRYTLRRGEMLVANNLATLHSRTAYEDDPEGGTVRQLLRSWMWRRHQWPGGDPALLDMEELA